MSGEVVLHLELEPGRNADAEVAAELLTAWVRLVKAGAEALAPNAQIRVELLGLQEGSLEFRQVVKWLDDRAGELAAGADEYPNLKRLGVALATAVLAAGAQTAMMPEVQKVEVVEPEAKKVAEAPSVQAASKEFFAIAQRDRAITEVAVTEEPGGPKEYCVPREDFAERSGLWGGQTIDPDQSSMKTVEATWNVILVKPAAVGQPRAWRFSRDGIEFSAVMEDTEFLDAIREGRVPISLQEGVVMRILVRYRERLVGQVWEYVPSTRRVAKVVSPLSRPRPIPLPFPDDPEEN